MTRDILNLVFGGAPAKKTPTKKATTKKTPTKKTTKKSDEKLPSGRVMGKVVSYNPARGFGFVKVMDSDVDVFIHHTVLAETGIKEVKPEMVISFEIQTSNDDPKCKDKCVKNVKIEKGQKGGWDSGFEEQELFHRLLNTKSDEIRSYFEMSGINPAELGMVGGGRKNLSKLAMINALLSE